MFTSQEWTFSDTCTFDHQSPPRHNLFLSHLVARLHTPAKWHPWSHFSHKHARAHTHLYTHSIRRNWVSEPLNESGWLGPQRAVLTFPSTSSPPCACVFLWVSGCKLLGVRHFTSNVTDLNEMPRQRGGRKRWQSFMQEKDNAGSKLQKDRTEKMLREREDQSSALALFIYCQDGWVCTSALSELKWTERQTAWVRPPRSEWARGKWGFVWGCNCWRSFSSQIKFMGCFGSTFKRLVERLIQYCMSFKSWSIMRNLL